MLSKKKKDAIIKKFKVHDKDTGSSEVQIAILTEEIKELTKHLKSHKHDVSSRRGLLRKVNLRRKLLRYLSRENPKSYTKLITTLKIKKRKYAEGEDENLVKAMKAAEEKKAEASKGDSDKKKD